LTLPTGDAVSPPYFLEAMNKILKYRPALDKNGDPIIDETNKVKLIWDPLPDSFIYMDDVSCGTKLCKTYKETLDFHFLKLEEILQLHFLNRLYFFYVFPFGFCQNLNMITDTVEDVQRLRAYAAQQVKSQSAEPNVLCRYHVGADYLLQQTGSARTFKRPAALGAIGPVLAYIHPGSSLSSSPHIMKMIGGLKSHPYIQEPGYDSQFESICKQAAVTITEANFGVVLKCLAGAGVVATPYIEFRRSRLSIGHTLDRVALAFKELCATGDFPIPEELAKDLRKLGLADKPDVNRSYMSDYVSDDERRRRAVRRPRGGPGPDWYSRRGPDDGPPRGGGGGAGGFGGGGAPDGRGRRGGNDNGGPSRGTGGYRGGRGVAPTTTEPVAGPSGIQSAALAAKPKRTRKRGRESRSESSSTDTEDEYEHGQPISTSTAKKPARDAAQTTLSAGSLQPILEAIERTVDLEQLMAADRAEDRAERTIPPGVEDYEALIRREEADPVCYRRVPDDELSRSRRTPPREADKSHVSRHDKSKGKDKSYRSRSRSRERSKERYREKEKEKDKGKGKGKGKCRKATIISTRCYAIITIFLVPGKGRARDSSVTSVAQSKGKRSSHKE
jgi:hypothetical protein